MYPTLFDVSVDSVVRHWFSLIVEYKSFIQDGLVHAAVWIIGVFYVDDGLL